MSSVRDREAVDVEKTTKRFFDFIHDHYEQVFGTMAPDQKPGLGFLVAGYSKGEHLASEWEFALPQATEPVRVRPQDEIGTSWRGVAFPFTRLMFGVDPTLEQLLVQAGMPPGEVQRFKNASASLATAVPFDGMPLQDAIGYCKFIIQTTIGWCTYALGAAMCGGPIRLATITPGAGFDWVTPPKHYVEGEKHV